MLLGNYSVLYKHPGRDIGGGAIGLGSDRGAFNKTSMARGVFNAVDWEPKSGVPDGYRPPYTWVIPQTDGGLSARNVLAGSGSLTATGAMGLNAISALVGSGSLTATGALIVQAIAALTGSGSITTANLQAILSAIAALAGTGTLTSTTTANAYAVASLLGSGTLSATRYATGALVANITPFTTLSPENLAASVWNALAVDSNESGTMGEKVNDAGSASNPWTEVIEGSYTAAELLRIIAAALAGEVSGAATTTITIQGVDGATDRIVATVDSDGDRTAVTLDGS